MIEAFLAGELAAIRAGGVRKGLREEESMLMRFLERLNDA